MRSVSLVLFTCVSILSLAMAVLGQVHRAEPTGRIKFEVSDAAKEPISTAFVYVHANVVQSEQQDLIVSLDLQGRAESVLRPGLYDVFVSAAGFAPKCSVVEVLPDRSAQVTLKMSPDSKHLQQ
jgi:hypothetical protein